MLVTKHDESKYSVHYRSYWLSLLLLLVPPALLYELFPGLLAGSLETGELAGLIIGIVLPLVGAYFLLEFASFSFSIDDDVFRWRWHNLVRKKTGEVPLGRIAQVRREALETSSGGNLRYSYRLVVILDDDTVIPLTRGFSSIHDRQLDKIVDQIREHLGHIVPMP